MASGTVQRAGFILQNGQPYKKVFKNKKATTFGAPRFSISSEGWGNTDILKYFTKAGHVGVGNTRQNCIKEDSMKIWWKGINNDVKEYRKKCSICVKSGAPPKKSGELQSIVPPKKASSFWGMDH